MSIDISVDRQSLNPPVRPVCPEAPVWPVEPLALQAVTVSHLVSDACPSQCKALIARHACMHPYDKLESKPTCETGLPRSPGLACGAARPCRQSQCLSLCQMPVLLNAKALTICHVNRHLSGTPESQPTSETRLPRGPGLACGAARPCRQSQCLTLCQMPALLNAKL